MTHATMLIFGLCAVWSACGGNSSPAFRSLTDARDYVRREKAKGLPEGGLAVVLSSEIRISDTLELDERDSGEPGRPIVWRGEGAVLDGGRRADLTSGENVFADNDVHETGLVQLTYSPGLLLKGVGGRVERNWFHDMPSSALRLGGNDHLVESNVVERCVLVSDDQGALDIFGNPTYLGIRIVRNVWRDIGGGGPYAPCGQAGVRFDDYVSGLVVSGNLFDNCSKAGFGGVQINGGRCNVIEDNVFTNCSYALSMTLMEDRLWNCRWERIDRDEKYVSEARWRERYPVLRELRTAPQANVLRRNRVFGCRSLLRGDKPGALDHMPKDAGDNKVWPR